MKVSIQIPCYNQSNYIEKTIQSALNQTYENIEIIVNDDCSTDDTYSKAMSFNDSRLKVYKNEKNIGRVANYQKLLYELVTGDWVVNLDGDDWFTDNNFISIAINNIKNNSNISFYQANQKKIKLIKYYCKSVRNIDSNTIIVNGEEYLSHYKKYMFFNHLAVVYNRKLALDLNFYSDDSLITDFTSIMKLCKNHQIIFNSNKIGYWNINMISESNNMINTKEHQKNILTIQSLINFFSNSPHFKNIEDSMQSILRKFKNNITISNNSKLDNLKFLINNPNSILSILRFFIKPFKSKN